MCGIIAYSRARQQGKIKESKWPKATCNYKSARKGARERHWRRCKE
jgi:hypothetical protein